MKRFALKPQKETTRGWQTKEKLVGITYSHCLNCHWCLDACGVSSWRILKRKKKSWWQPFYQKITGCWLTPSSSRQRQSSSEELPGTEIIPVQFYFCKQPLDHCIFVKARTLKTSMPLLGRACFKLCRKEHNLPADSRQGMRALSS